MKTNWLIIAVIFGLTGISQSPKSQNVQKVKNEVSSEIKAIKDSVRIVLDSISIIKKENQQLIDSALINNQAIKTEITKSQKIANKIDNLIVLIKSEKSRINTDLSEIKPARSSLDSIPKVSIEPPKQNTSQKKHRFLRKN